MKIEDFFVTPCRGRLATEFVPKKKESLDMRLIGEILTQNGARIDVQTSMLIVFQVQNVNVSLFKSGKLIVKDVDETVGRQIAAFLVPLIPES